MAESSETSGLGGSRSGTIAPGGQDVNCLPGTKIAKPSACYDAATEAHAYRLSELIFGSLLAAYILGFVSFGMVPVGAVADFKPIAEVFSSTKLLQVLNYLIISGTFSYLTAAYYVTYHNAILTMPQVPEHKLRTNFGIALLQAVLFGFSMVRPDGFLLFLGISLAVVFWRQRTLFNELAELFQREQGSGTVDHKSERRHFERILVEINNDDKFRRCIEGWIPIEPWKSAGAVLLIVLGILSEARHYIEAVSKIAKSNPPLTGWCQFVLYLLTSLVICIAANHILSKRALHKVLQTGSQPQVYLIDEAATELVNRLKQKT